MKLREIHGYSHRPEYRIWANIVQRCCNPNNTNYSRYGGAGVHLCKEWRESFSAFIGYLGDRPSPHHSVDRIDWIKGYEPGNVRWAALEEQAQNKASTMWITARGETHCLSEWARLTGVPTVTIYSRIKKFGWAAEKALTPSKKGRRSRAILSEPQVAEMRRRSAMGEDSASLALEFGVNHSTAWRAVTGRTYALDLAIGAEKAREGRT